MDCFPAQNLFWIPIAVYGHGSLQIPVVSIDNDFKSVWVAFQSVSPFLKPRDWLPVAPCLKSCSSSWSTSVIRSSTPQGAVWHPYWNMGTIWIQRQIPSSCIQWQRACTGLQSSRFFFKHEGYLQWLKSFIELRDLHKKRAWFYQVYKWLGGWQEVINGLSMEVWKSNKPLKFIEIAWCWPLGTAFIVTGPFVLCCARWSGPFISLPTSKIHISPLSDTCCTCSRCQKSPPLPACGLIPSRYKPQCHQGTLLCCFLSCQVGFFGRRIQSAQVLQ